MELILFGIGFVAVLSLLVIKANKRDLRFAGYRLGAKGILVFAIGFLIGVVGSSIENSSVSKSIQLIGNTVAIIGFAIAIVGNVKHVKSMFGPFDARRAVDPNYDVSYTKCPHCHKVEVRVTGRKAKCPICGGVIRADEGIDA